MDVEGEIQDLKNRKSEVIKEIAGKKCLGWPICTEILKALNELKGTYMKSADKAGISKVEQDIESKETEIQTFDEMISLLSEGEWNLFWFSIYCFNF